MQNPLITLNLVRLLHRILLVPLSNSSVKLKARMEQRLHTMVLMILPNHIMINHMLVGRQAESVAQAKHNGVIFHMKGGNIQVAPVQRVKVMLNLTRNMMHNEIENWIKNALVAPESPNRSMDSTEAERVRSEAQIRFVSGSPRVWWLGFAMVKSTHSSETMRLSDLVHDPDAIGWFIPETEESCGLVYRLNAHQVEAVVADCPFFEYYFLTAEKELLIAETDHNQFIVTSPLSDMQK